MAVDQSTSRIQGYWTRFISRAISLSVVGQMVVVAAAVLLAMKDGGQNWKLGIAALIIGEVVVQAITLYCVLRPQKRLYDSILGAAYGKESAASTQLTKWDEASGLAALVKVIEGRTNTPNTPVSTAQDPKKYILDALQLTNVGIVMFGQSKKLLYSNAAAPVRTGYDDETALDLAFDASDTLTDWIDNAQASAVKAERIWRRVPSLPSASEDKEQKYYDVIANFSGGSEVEVTLVTIDHSEGYSQEQNDLNLIAFAAHELRGPVTIIRGYLEMLEDDMQGELTPENQQVFHRLEVSANRLSTYISNILNTSRYDQQQLNIYLSEQNIRTIFNSIEDDAQLRANTQGRTLTINVPDDLPPIAADASGLGEVFTNLIDNGIKYSNEGGLVEVSAHANDDNTISVDIVDHGIGMPANVVGNLFKKFYRSHRSRGSTIGTGIGLYISRAIIARHDGTLSVASTEGEGSTFTVTLPTYDSIKDKLQDGNISSSSSSSSSSSMIKNHGALK